MPLITCCIEKVVHGGLGLARTGTGVLFVAGGLPGEEVTAALIGSRSSTPLARITALHHPSPLRREPFCPYAGSCGGCDWQHITYPDQVDLKKMIWCELLQRIGHIESLPPMELFHAQEQGYRHRVQFKLDAQRAMGFYARGTTTVVPVAHCPLLVQELNELAALPPRLLPHVANLKALAGEEGVASRPLLDGRTGASTIMRCAAAVFRVDGDGFFQQNRFLIEPLTAWVGSRVRGPAVVDLYGGCGLFLICSARHCSRGVLVESQPSLARRAEENLAANSLSHFTVSNRSAESFLAQTTATTLPPDTVIVDPPRSGLTRAVRLGLARMHPRRIVYVSCDPATQARDGDYFVNKCGYHITEGALFDLYPNTHHMECVLVLDRSEGTSSPHARSRHRRARTPYSPKKTVL